VTPAAPRGGERRVESCALRRAPDERAPREFDEPRRQRNRRRRRLPQDLAYGDRQRQSLQRELADVREAMTAPARECLDQCAREDLAGLRRRAQARRFDDDEPMNALGVLVRFARCDADARLRGRSRVAPLTRLREPLLDGDSTCDGVARALERREQPVARVLDLATAGCRERLAHDGQRSLAPRLSRIASEPRQRLGRGDEIGEQHREQPGGCHRAGLSHRLCAGRSVPCSSR
jgi:hypothetical protein